MVRLYRATANYDMPEDGGEGGGLGGCALSHTHWVQSFTQQEEVACYDSLKRWISQQVEQKASIDDEMVFSPSSIAKKRSSIYALV